MTSITFFFFYHHGPRFSFRGLPGRGVSDHPFYLPSIRSEHAPHSLENARRGTILRCIALSYSTLFVPSQPSLAHRIGFQSPRSGTMAARDRERPNMTLFRELYSAYCTSP